MRHVNKDNYHDLVIEVTPQGEVSETCVAHNNQGVTTD